MGMQIIVLFGAFILLPNLVANFMLTWDIFNWVPAQSKKVQLLILVWLLPVAGARFTYRYLKLDWFNPKAPGLANTPALLQACLGWKQSLTRA